MNDVICRNTNETKLERQRDSSPWQPGRGGGYSSNVCTGRLRPAIRPLTTSYTVLPTKKVLLSYTFYWEWKKYPFQITEYFIPLLNTWNEGSEQYTTGDNQALPWEIVAEKQVSFAYVVIPLHVKPKCHVKSQLFLIPETWKSTPFGRSLSA